MKIKIFLNLWLPVFVWCSVIFLLSSMPTIETTKIFWWDFVMKKTAHIIEYGILYFLVYRAATRGFSKSINQSVIVYCLLFGLIYAFSDEYHQSFTPGRHSKLRDVGFDLTGMLLSLYLIKKFKNKFSRLSFISHLKEGGKNEN